MIAILLNDASFEQDIRELLMAFYPGETFTHKEEEAGEAELIVRGVRDGNSFSLDVAPVKKEAVHFALIYPDFSNRFETKNEIKQSFECPDRQRASVGNAYRHPSDEDCAHEAV